MATEPRGVGVTSTTDWVALFRGINVGTAKRVAMADLRAVLTAQGFTDVETLLNSGNAVFGSVGTVSPVSIRAAVAEETGVDADVVVLPATRFLTIAEANPLRRPGREAKRLQVAFAGSSLPTEQIAPAADSLAPEELALTTEAVYQWLPDGVLASRVQAAWWASLRTVTTARNDATVIKIVDVVARREAARPL